MHRSTHRPLLVAALAAASVLGFAAAAAVAPVAAVRADDVDTLVEALKAEVKGGDEGKIIAKLTELESKPDPRITDALVDIATKPFASQKSDRVFKTAIKMAAQRKDEAAFKFLKAKLKDDKLAEDHVERFYAVLDSLAFYDKMDKAALKALDDVVKKHLATDSGISTRAITAYGGVREEAVIEQLIEWLAQTEQTKAGGQGSGKMSDLTRKNYGEATPAIVKCLEKATNETYADSASWKDWWKAASKKGYTFPDPNVSAEPDWATVNPYVDSAYGFTLKKPEVDKFWGFAKCEDKGGRVQLFNKDESSMLWARCDAIVQKTWKDAGNAEQLAKYFENHYRETFDPFSAGGEPAVKAEKIGGRDFLVLSAKGKASGTWVNWDVCERRVYITMINPNLFLYFNCAIRGGAEEPVKAAFWKTMDELEFKAPSK